MTTTGEMLQDDGGAPTPGRSRPLRRRVVVVTLVTVVALIGAGFLVIWRGASGYYAISPGSAPVVSDSKTCRPAGSGSYVLPDGRACVQLVVPADRSRPLDGSIMMVDVLVGPASPGDYLLSKLGLLHSLRDGTILVPSSEILGSTPPSQLGCQDTQQMDDAQSAATVVALRRLGYTVTEHDLGARVDQVAPGTPAAAAGVHCNDVVTAVDGHPVHTADQLVGAIRALRPGDRARITVSRPGAHGGQTTVQLQATLTGTPAQSGTAADPQRAFLGVQTETRTTFTYPFNVDVNVGAIGGPSAGLALTLGLIDSLSNGQLTGGHHIAATGTMDLAGNVGDVGGVAQKAVAVRKAGATVFFVPVQEAAAARSEAGSMKVVPVSTLTQVLDDLKAMGGHLPAPAAGAVALSASGAG